MELKQNSGMQIGADLRPATELKPAAKVARGIFDQKEETPPEATWDDLEDMYHKLFQLMVDRPRVINTLIETIGETNIEKDKELMIAHAGMSDDIFRFAEKLNEIHAIHKGFQGKIAKEDIPLSIDVSLQYDQFRLEYEALISQPIGIIREKIESAINRLHQGYKVYNPQPTTPEIEK